MSLRIVSLVSVTAVCVGFLACSSAGGGGSGAQGGAAGSGGAEPVGGGSGSGGVGPISGTGGGGSPIDLGDASVPNDADCDNILEVTYRDFTEAHEDMEMAFSGDVVRLQLVEAALGADQKPVFKSSVGCAPDNNDPTKCHEYYKPMQPVITSATTFDQWYRTVEGVNQEIPGTVELTESPAGSGQYVYDNMSFFPLGPDQGFGISPASNHLGRNFLFTTEIHVRFKYSSGQVFTFRGDDDLWIFVNGKLALDLGSMHSPVEGTIDFDAQAEALGISPGGSYSMDVFHAERHMSDSNFRFQTNISCFEPVIIR
jgi:fibro-slime domain-containing protein